MYRYISKINKNILFKPSIFLVFDTKVFIIESFQDDHQELIGLVYTSEWNKIYKKAVFLLKNVTIFFIEEMAYQKKNKQNSKWFLFISYKQVDKEFDASSITIRSMDTKNRIGSLCRITNQFIYFWIF